ncbi:hypothetical protein [Rhizobium sp. Leaf453]|uniref:hypothetical protein n=1 Tax=Rhizobium sp. Leaf453 TaxID=1736380 RepID=UPI000713929E|nr:hypothetical protein ASG68_25575 [Rhizobium sp. Leaf453]
MPSGCYCHFYGLRQCRCITVLNKNCAAAIVEENMLPGGSRFFPKPCDDLTITEAMAGLLSGGQPKTSTI